MMEATLNLTGHVALVTGGNNGIGRAIALTYAQSGASVAILGRNSERNAFVLAELKDLGVEAMSLDVDVSERDRLQPALESVEQRLGPVSILVNNAGTAAVGGVLSVSLDEWDRVLETNLTAPFVLSKYAGRSMAEHRRGKIINIASASVFYGYVRLTSYAVSKAALVHLTECMAVEFGPFNVQVNAIVPGWIDTDMAQRMKQSPVYAETVALTPAGRWGVPQEIADVALFLASGGSTYVNGATLTVDGGMSQTYGAAKPTAELPEL
jgi:2-deoxy-D-gluconate 3-dehydrogenase